MRTNKNSREAKATFIGFLEPSDFPTAFLIPKASKTTLTAPPAITPVPGAAGLISTVSYTHLTLPTNREV